MEDANLTPGNPLRPVDWRLRLAQSAVQTGRFLPDREADKLTCRICDYLRLPDGSNRSCFGARPGSQRFDNIRRAFELRDTNLGVVVEALLLTGMNDDAIAARCSTTPACIGWFAAAFFDVRSRIDSSHYIVQEVIEPRRTHNGGDWRRYGWLAIAYRCGADALDQVMAATKVEDLSQLTASMRLETELILRDRLLAMGNEIGTDHADVLLNLLQASAPSKESPGALHSRIGENIDAALRAMPFSVGEPRDPSSASAEYDGSAAELNAAELMLVTAGTGGPNLEIFQALRFPDSPISVPASGATVDARMTDVSTPK